MGLHIRNEIPYGGTVNQSTMIKHRNSTVANELDTIKSNLSDIDLSNTSLPSEIAFKDLIKQIAEKVFPKLLHVVKNGRIGLAFDATVYRMNSTQTASSMQWAYNDTYLLCHNCISTQGVNAGYSTSNKIDFSNFKKLTVVGRAASNRSWVTKEMDLNGAGERYLIINTSKGTDNNVYLRVVLSSQKELCNNDDAIKTDVDYVANPASTLFVQVQDIILE